MLTEQYEYKNITISLHSHGNPFTRILVLDNTTKNTNLLATISFLLKSTIWENLKLFYKSPVDTYWYLVISKGKKYSKIKKDLKHKKLNQISEFCPPDTSNSRYNLYLTLHRYRYQWYTDLSRAAITLLSSLDKPVTAGLWEWIGQRLIYETIAKAKLNKHLQT